MHIFLLHILLQWYHDESSVAIVSFNIIKKKKLFYEREDASYIETFLKQNK